ncbi:MAG: universal stress protein [Deltaproteobacteria bacterium]|nr:universal stress protein [Deltaproteobacteria bacterium]
MLPEIKRVLYATDLSENSALAFRYAIELAERHDGEIVILHVLEELPPNTKALVSLYLGEENLRKALDQKSRIQEEIRKRLQSFCDREVKGDPTCTTKVSEIAVTEGYPADEILKKADELNCDVIVMGTHGKGIISHTFLGSVAQRVLRRVRKPVFIIPIPKDHQGIQIPDI